MPYGHYYPNKTPVVVLKGTAHKSKNRLTYCKGYSGKVVTLVQALVWLDVYWCPKCWGNNKPQ